MKRKEYVKVVDDVRDAGGDVKIFSTMHVSGERKLKLCIFKRDNLQITFVFLLELSQLTGIAAILRFPLPELEDTDDEDANDNDDSD